MGTEDPPKKPSQQNAAFQTARKLKYGANHERCTHFKRLSLETRLSQIIVEKTLMPGAHFPIYRDPVDEESEERDAVLGLPDLRKSDGTRASRKVDRVYPWLNLGGEERKSAVVERRKVLLTQILALDVPAEDLGYVLLCARWPVCMLFS